MEVQRAFPHHWSVFIFQCTLGVVIPSASSSCGNYTAHLSVPAYTSIFASFSFANYTTDLCASASICILLLSHYATLTSAYVNDNYHVSVNHYWPDVGKTFASHLSRTLISQGLPTGNVETAFLHIAIFSKNYAKSSSCLNELLIMLKSGKPIIPVFYDVDPSDLNCHVMFAPVLRMFRWTPLNNESLYCEDLRMLEGEKTFDPQTCEERPRHDSSTIAEWRTGLSDTSRIVGFKRADYNGDEGRLVHDVVKHVLSIKEPKTPIHYDVFINHRGTDVKNTLASHLYYRLRDHVLQVFFDREEAQKGFKVDSELKNAIRFASVHIAILSRRYAESEYCMDELVLMVESRSVIIPVFYDVNPTDIWWNHVHGMNGVYDEALLKLKEEKIFNPETGQEEPRYDSHDIEILTQALMEVTGRDGFQLETYDGDEGQLADAVVEKVVKTIREGQRNNFFERTMF